MTLDIPVKIDCPVVSEGEWHNEQPIEFNRLAPLVVNPVGGAGVAGAVNRLKAAKFTKSADISEAVPIGRKKKAQPRQAKLGVGSVDQET